MIIRATSASWLTPWSGPVSWRAVQSWTWTCCPLSWRARRLAPGEAPVFAEITAAALNEAREAAIDAVERSFLKELMSRCEGNVSRASREAGLHRSYLQKLLARHREALGSLVDEREEA